MVERIRPKPKSQPTSEHDHTECRICRALDARAVRISDDEVRDIPGARRQEDSGQRS